MASDPDSMHDLLRRRARDLGKSVASLAAEAGLARTYLYKLASGGTADPSVRTLVRLAAAMQVAPVALIRRYADLGMGGQPSGLPTSGTTLAHAPGNAGDRIVCNGDVTVPDHSVVKGGEAFRKVWEVQNLGELAWQGRRLVRADRQYVIAERSLDGALRPIVQAHLLSLQEEVVVPDLPPGGCAQLAVDFVAPRENCSIASVWRLEDRAGRPFYGPTFFLQVIVTVIEH